MKKPLVALFILTSALTSVAQAKESRSLTCALSPNQSIADMNGYLVFEGATFGHGRPTATTTLHSIQDGTITETKNLSETVERREASELEKEEIVYHILKKARINPENVDYAKSVNITDGDPSVTLVNFFTKEDKLLGGAILVPMGGIQICYPVTDDQDHQ